MNTLCLFLKQMLINEFVFNKTMCTYCFLPDVAAIIFCFLVQYKVKIVKFLQTLSVQL